MTFDLERYRTHIAPLKLTKEQEDKLLDDLWKIAETLVDQSLISPTYPLQFAIAHGAFDSIEAAVRIESEDIQKTKEQTKNTEEKETP